jgi:hypothetical protein
MENRRATRIRSRHLSPDTGGADGPRNPLGWFGYDELQQVSIDRQSSAAPLIAFAAFLVLFIRAVVFRVAS